MTQLDPEVGGSRARGLTKREAAMGTLVAIQVCDATQTEALERAIGWFPAIEEVCSRFRADSELMRVCSAPVGRAVEVSPILFEAVRFALLVAEETEGAFDPTVGRSMEALGFDREHRSGKMFRSGEATAASFRDVEVDERRQSIRLHRPLTLDLGAVAKGLAIDTAARELEEAGDFLIDAGGDVYVGGVNPKGEPWSVGIQHPRHDSELIERLRVSNMAVCTSGDYAKPSPEGRSHILDPRRSARKNAGKKDAISATAISTTVVAPSAMLADALATAAFVLGPQAGIELLAGHGVEGMMITGELRTFETPGFGQWRGARAQG